MKNAARITSIFTAASLAVSAVSPAFAADKPVTIKPHNTQRVVNGDSFDINFKGPGARLAREVATTQFVLQETKKKHKIENEKSGSFLFGGTEMLSGVGGNITVIGNAYGNQSAQLNVYVTPTPGNSGNLFASLGAFVGGVGTGLFGAAAWAGKLAPNINETSNNTSIGSVCNVRSTTVQAGGAGSAGGNGTGNYTNCQGGTQNGAYGWMSNTSQSTNTWNYNAQQNFNLEDMTPAVQEIITQHQHMAALKNIDNQVRQNLASYMSKTNELKLAA